MAICAWSVLFRNFSELKLCICKKITLGIIYLWHPWKTSDFCTSPPSPFLSVWMGPNWAKAPLSWTSKLRLSTTPHPHPPWYSGNISIIFNKRFHHMQSSCNSQLFTTKNQFKLNLIFCSKTQTNTSYLGC